MAGWSASNIVAISIIAWRICLIRVNLPDGRKVLSVRIPSDDPSKNRANEYILPVVSKVHGTRERNESGSQQGDETDEALPCVTLTVENVEFACEIERQEAESSKGD